MKYSKRTLIGIFILIIGTFLLMDNLGFIPYELYFLRSWQMILIITGVYNLLSGKRNPGIILTSIGTFFLLEDYGPYDFRDYWPVILIIIGAAFVLTKKKINVKSNEDNYFDEINIFGGGDRCFASKELEGGRITNIFGGTTVDLRDSEPVQDTTIDIFTLFGGCEIILRDEWRVNVKVFTIFGGFSDERQDTPQDSESPTITLKGFTVFGSGELKSVKGK